MKDTLIEAIARALCEAQGCEATENEMARARDEAQAALTAITEAGYEICPKGTMAALDASRVAIDDWLNTYAPDECNENRVKEARTRIFENGGTLDILLKYKNITGRFQQHKGTGNDRPMDRTSDC